MQRRVSGYAGCKAVRPRKSYAGGGVSRLWGLNPGHRGVAIPGGGMSVRSNCEMDHVGHTSGNAHFFRPYPLEPGIP